MSQSYFAQFFQWAAQENLSTSVYILEHTKLSYII